MKIKTLITKMLFNERQRAMIWRALVYSAYKYRKHGNVDRAAAVQTVMNELADSMGVIPSVFTKEQVDKIVDDVYTDAKHHVNKAYNAGLKEGYILAQKDMQSGLAVGAVLDFEKCATCPNKENCVICQAIEDAEKSEGETTDNATPAAEEAEQPEAAEEGDTNKTED